MRAIRSLTNLCFSARNFHSTSLMQYPRRTVGIQPPPILAKTGLLLDETDLDETIPFEERNGHGSSSAGHLLLRQQRHMLQYMRLIEHDMPKLVRWREPFVPPSSENPLVVRTIDYGGEEHPATAKRTVVVSVDRLPLHGPNAKHTVKLLAGPRWFPTPPPDSGIGPTEGKDNNGYIKISCEDFPQPGMNLKWISDVLDRLILDANANGSKFANVPQDLRHFEAKKRKAKNGENHGVPRPSIKDFPRAWLPQAPLALA